MKRAGWMVLVAVMCAAVLSGSLLAQETRSQDQKPAEKKTEAAAANPMEALAPFAGNWWAEIKPQDGNPPMRVDVEMKWADNHRAINFQVWFTQLGDTPKKAPEYYGVYLYDPAKKALLMYQTNSKGDLSTGQIAGDGKNYTQKTHVDRMNGTTQEQDSVIVFDDDKNAFNWRVSIQKDGQWVEAVKLRYERVKTTAKAGGMQ